MSTNDEVLTLLRSIDASLKRLVAAVPPAPLMLASDEDLSGPYGDPVVRAKDPKSWTGPSMIGKRYSETTPAYLDAIASRLEYFATKAEQEGTLTSSGKPVAPFNRRDAARARGHAARLRAGWKPAEDDGAALFSGDEPAPAAEPMLTDLEIPFAILLPLALSALSVLG